MGAWSTLTSSFTSQQPSMYASMFTMACFLIFGFPLFSSVYLCADLDVQVWIGYWPLVGLLWVLVFLLAHFMHLRYQRPKKSLMMACMFAPSVWFFFAGWLLLAESTHYYTVFRGAGCAEGMGSPEVVALNDAYLEAKAFHARCLDHEGKQNILIHYCAGYERAESQLKGGDWQWEYLRYAEKNFGCAGFCGNMQPTLWTFQGIAKDGCSAAVGNIMATKVHEIAVRLMAYSVIVVIAFLLWIEIIGPSLNAYLDRMPPPATNQPRFTSRSKLLGAQGGAVPPTGV